MNLQQLAARLERADQRLLAAIRRSSRLAQVHHPNARPVLVVEPWVDAWAAAVRRLRETLDARRDVRGMRLALVSSAPDHRAPARDRLTVHQRCALALDEHDTDAWEPVELWT